MASIMNTTSGIVYVRSITGGLTISSGQLLAPDGTVAAPSYSFTSETNSGVYRIGAGEFGFTFLGALSHRFSNGVFRITSDSGRIGFGASDDLSLSRLAADTLGLRRGTNTQVLRVGPSTSYLELRQGDGTQSYVGSAGATSLTFFTGGTDRWSVNGSTGHLLAAGAYNIGDGAGNSPVDIHAEGLIKSYSATAGVGYGTGAGGTVAQITSKSTGVTLNTVTGEITMNGAALAANTSVSFTWTNTAIAEGDVVVWNISGGTAGAYTVTCDAGAGTATVTVRNVTAGSLSEAIVLSFVVIKGVTA